MQILTIKTERTNDGFKAWLADKPNVKSTSTGSAYGAAENLAIKVFVGHNHRAQISEAVLSKIVVTPRQGGGYRATYDA
ncbi:MAG: hypothetical protein ABW208_07330 [Pyrinomonadaceae bacterium]